MSKKEFHNIERFEDREAKFGLTIKGLLAVIDDDDENGIEVSVRGEVHVVDESKFPEYVQIVVSALNEDGKIMDTSHESYESDEVMDFASLECILYNLIEKPTSIRIYPQKV